MFREEMMESLTDKKTIKVLRTSNQTVVVSKTENIIDSDKSTIEDENGHRYMRNIPLEIYTKTDKYIYKMI